MESTFNLIFFGILPIFYIAWGLWRIVDLDKTWERYVRKAISRGIKPESLERTPQWGSRERRISVIYILVGIVGFFIGILLS